MATRGHLGGLALATPEAVRVLDAVGHPWVVIETVGVGQVEVEIAGEADTTVVVVNPGWGDAVQANKAGLLEVADVFVINKADRAGRRRHAPRPRADARPVRGAGDWRPPIVATVATTGEGVDELWSAIGDHRAHLERDGRLEARRARRARRGRAAIVAARLLERADRRCRDTARRARGRGPPVASSTPGPPPTELGSVGSLGDDARMTGPRRGRAARRRRRAHPPRPPEGQRAVERRCSPADEAAKSLTADPPGAVVVTGGDRVFAAGADIGEFGGRTRREMVGACSCARSTPSPTSRGRRSRRSAATPSAAGASSRSRATSASRRSEPGSASPRSCSASSPAAAARSGCRGSSAGAGEGPDPHRTADRRRGGAAASGSSTRSFRHDELHERALAQRGRSSRRVRSPRRRSRSGRSTRGSTAPSPPVSTSSSSCSSRSSTPTTPASASSRSRSTGPGKATFTGR